MKSVSFRNRAIRLAGHLHLPEAFDAARQYSAVVIATPGSSVKEQIGATYARQLALQGFVALTFDPSYQGESGGEPRDLEDPASRAEDLRCAVDYLVTEAFVDEERIALLGVCAGGGYAIHAALTEHRFKAVGTVVATDMGTAFRKMYLGEDAQGALQRLGAQRTAEARGAAHRRDPWIPDSLAQAEAAGIQDQELLRAVRYYRESVHRHPHSTNRLLFQSYSSILSFDAFHLVDTLLLQPLQVIVGGRRGNTGQYEAGERLFRLAPHPQNDFHVIPGAGHYDLYDQPRYVVPAVERLAAFYRRHLAPAD